MGLARSTYYDRPTRPADDTALVEALFAICDAFEFYGYRRAGGALRARAQAGLEPVFPGRRSGTDGSVLETGGRSVRSHVFSQKLGRGPGCRPLPTSEATDRAVARLAKNQSVAAEKSVIN